MFFFKKKQKKNTISLFSKEKQSDYTVLTRPAAYFKNPCRSLLLDVKVCSPIFHPTFHGKEN